MQYICIEFNQIRYIVTYFSRKLSKSGTKQTKCWRIYLLATIIIRNQLNLFINILQVYREMSLPIQQNKISTQSSIKSDKQTQYQKERDKYLSKPNYIFGSNIFEFLSFMWVSPLLKLGQYKPIDEDLIPHLKENESKQQFTNFSKKFQQYNKSNTKNSEQKKYKKLLLKFVLSYYKKEIIIFTIMCIFLVSLQIYNSILSYEIINYIGDKNLRNISDNCKYFFIYAAVSFAIVLLHHYSEYILLIRSMDFFSTMNLMIYDKTLKYPLISDKQFSPAQILNYSQIDVNRFLNAGYFLKETIRSILQLIVGIILLLFYIGVTFLIGFSALIVFFIFSYFFLKTIVKSSQNLIQKTDQRIKQAQQILQIIKYIKVNILQKYFLSRIEQKRKSQLKTKLKIRISDLFNKLAHVLSPSIVVFITLFAYISFYGQMTTTKAFFLIIIFRNIQSSLKTLTECLGQVINYSVSLKRIQTFLLAIELQQKDNPASSKNIQQQNSNFAVIIQNGNFLWQKDGQESKLKKSGENKGIDTQKQMVMPRQSLDNIQTQQEQQGKEKTSNFKFPAVQFNGKKYFKVLRDINLKFKKKQTTMIIGDVGSGKSSILHAIANEIVVQPQSNTKLYVDGQIAYCSQKPWIMNGTVKENILMYQPYSQQRLKDAIHYACLEEDLKIMPEGIESMIGQKGINLSGGQKARVSLARALYFDRDIYLLDDILSAVDVHVGRFIMECTIKDYLKNKTIIMPTHSVKFLNQANQIVIMEKGRVEVSGTYQSIKKEQYFQQLINQELQNKNQPQQSQKFQTNQKQLNPEILFVQEKIEAQRGQVVVKDNVVQELMIPEDKESGQVSSRVYTQYVKLNGGKSFAFLVLFLMSGWAALVILSNLEIMKWCNDQNRSKSHLYLYLGFSAGSIVFLGLNFIYLSFCQNRVGNKFHKKVLETLMYAGLNEFFNRVPIGRILNRLTKDVSELDDITSVIFIQVLLSFFSLLLTLIISIIVSTPFALIPVAIVTFLWIILLSYFMKCQRECVRLQKIAGSPVATGLSELTTGIETIRLFKAGKNFSEKYQKVIEKSKRMTITRNTLQFWFHIRASLISLLVNYFIFGFCIFSQDKSDSEMGLLLTFIVSLIQEMKGFIFWSTLFRVKMISIERLTKLTELQPEPGYKNQITKQSQITKPTNQNGKIQFRNYSARYRKGLPSVLKNISLIVQPTKKVGIVGRTGAGKTTLVNCLMRFLEPVEGQLFINGTEVREYNIKELRDNITMIEQEPTLMNATFRENLDPANIYSQTEIRTVINECNLINMIQSKGGLDSAVTNSTISVGEKQLLCICRAILKKTRIVIIDEATANVDVNNDQLIQKVIKKGFKDSTVLTIAHRLSTLEESDQILVLSQGQVVEWGEPKELKSRNGSIFGRMCSQNDRSYLD